MNYDTISRADVIKIIKSVLSPASSLVNVARARRQMLNEINELESKSEPHWIPVTEKLPYAECGESDNVLATCGYRDVEDGSIRWIKTLYFNGGNWCYPTGETYLEKVYAWMPLPEPYKGGEQDE